MNVTTSIFQQVGDIFLASKRRKDAEYAAFLAFYKTLVEETDSAVATAVGKITVTVIENGTEYQNWGVLLSVTDYIFWKQKIADGVRFRYGPDRIKAAILETLSKKAESNKLTAEERKALIAILDGQ